MSGYCVVSPQFNATVVVAKPAPCVNGSRAKRSLPAANRLKTHCNSGHELAGKNLRIDTKGGRLCRACCRLRTTADREDNRERNRAARKAGTVRYGYTKNVVNLIPRETMAEAFAAVRETGLLKAGAPIVGEWKWRALIFFDKKIHATMKKLLHRPTTIVSTPALSFKRPNCASRLLDIVNAAVPRALPRDMRDDIIADMMLALLEGRLKPQDIGRRAVEFVRNSFKIDHNKFGPLSLDMPAFREGTTPLVETISQGLWQ